MTEKLLSLLVLVVAAHGQQLQDEKRLPQAERDYVVPMERRH
jgi:hypothetical protein